MRVGTVQSVGTKVLPEVFRRFHELRPGVNIELEESHDPAILLSRVMDGELDVTFAEEPLPIGRFTTRHILDDPFVLMAPAGSPESALESVTVEHIATLPLIGYRNPSCLSLTIGIFDRLAETPRFVFQSDDNSTIQGLVGAGVGYALVPLLTTEPDDPAVTFVPIDPSARAAAHPRGVARRPASEPGAAGVRRRRRGGVRRPRSDRTGGVNDFLSVVAGVARRPALWSTATRQARRLAPNRWWRRRPFVPVPDRAWLRFRAETQYGEHGTGRLDPADVVVWLAWARATDRRNRPPTPQHRR